MPCAEGTRAKASIVIDTGKVVLFMNDITFAQLKTGEQATIVAVQGGCLQHRLRSVGLKEGKRVRVVAKHHFSGPMVVEVERRHITIGRGMAQKIIVARAS